ncbi:DUF6928 family protein [Actinocorallia populi]|uniref:DUF6928 family protein n=1 Tax=Actinocorallia populi TaxID=2079200 RepID=UPI000D08FD6D|nr:hypothetical protein [Actinocorallia populi]
MGWSAALACASIGDPERIFRPGLENDEGAALELARRLYPAATVEDTGRTVLDFALWPYDDELFIGVYDGALLVCDRRLCGLDEGARGVADAIASVLPGSGCGVLVLHSEARGCWFRRYDSGALVREVYLTAEDGVVVDQGEPLPAEAPYRKAIEASEADVPLPFDPEAYGLTLAAGLFGHDLALRSGDGFLPLELPVRRFRLT